MLQADEDADAWRLAQLDDSSGWISCVKVKMTPSRIESGVGYTSARPYCAIMSSETVWTLDMSPRANLELAVIPALAIQYVWKTE